MMGTQNSRDEMFSLYLFTSYTNFENRNRKNTVLQLNLNSSTTIVLFLGQIVENCGVEGVILRYTIRITGLNVVAGLVGCVLQWLGSSRSQHRSAGNGHKDYQSAGRQISRRRK